MAHATLRLVLLRSRPDTVHGDALHKTLLSTFLAARGPSIKYVEKGVQLCYSGLQIQGAATSPPTRSLYIIHHFAVECNRFFVFFLGNAILKWKILLFYLLVGRKILTNTSQKRIIKCGIKGVKI